MPSPYTLTNPATPNPTAPPAHDWPLTHAAEAEEGRRIEAHYAAQTTPRPPRSAPSNAETLAALATLGAYLYDQPDTLANAKAILALATLQAALSHTR